MLTFVVKSKNSEELQNKFYNFSLISKPILSNCIRLGINTLIQNATQPTVPYKTGNLINSFKQEVFSLYGKIFPTAKYSLYVHEGTKPHYIFPKNKQALYWEGARHPVKSVYHPGTSSNPYMLNIVKKSQVTINKIFKQGMNDIIKKIKI